MVGQKASGSKGAHATLPRVAVTGLGPGSVTLATLQSRIILASPVQATCEKADPLYSSCPRAITERPPPPQRAPRSPVGIGGVPGPD